MPETKVRAPGMFCWCDLSTPDTGAAKAFYGALFGWTFEDVPAGDAGTYTMIRLGSREVGGMAEQCEDMKAKGVPPHWLSYVLVENADEATAKAKELGALIMAEPFDVMDVGRMSVITDPTGATFALWQAKSHPGANAMDDPNTACWFECMSTNKEEAGAFYAGLFGWELESWPGEMDYTIFKQGETSTGGMMQITPEMGEVPSHWMIYFSVDDCDAYVGKARELGAQVTVPPTDISNVGRFAVMCDPTGAMFSVIQLEAAKG